MQRYLEIRTPVANSPTASSDLARHLLTRQHLGKIVIVCDKPLITISVVRKYWLKLSRTLQKERASTLNAEKILQLTYDITHMQHMEFVARPYHDNPNADVFFVAPSEIGQLPPQCFSLYILATLSEAQFQDALRQLPDCGLVVDYSHEPIMHTASLVSKRQLEQRALAELAHVERFLSQQHIDLHHLAAHLHHAEVVDEAIDVILATSNQFLRLTDDFLQLLRLAQPLQAPVAQQQTYDAIALLNRRVFALTPGRLSQHFTQIIGDEDASMHDIAIENLALILAT